MSPLAHRIYIATLTSIVVLTGAFLAWKGIPYYMTPLEERFYHPDHDWFKPSGVFGHGLGIVGTLLIVIGVFGYIARKKHPTWARFGRLKYWLEFHIFLCSLGPVMILFHTAFKFGGLVSVSFWSMVAVVASGIIGRFIYIRIPRTIEGRELSLGEVRAMSGSLEDETALNRRIERLKLMQKLFRYWHVAHMPFALIMLIIMVIHVAVTLTFGFKWIF